MPRTVVLHLLAHIVLVVLHDCSTPRPRGVSALCDRIAVAAPAAHVDAEQVVVAGLRCLCVGAANAAAEPLLEPLLVLLDLLERRCVALPIRLGLG